MAKGAKFPLSPRVLAEPFWDVVLSRGDEWVAEQAQLRERVNALEALRGQAAYDTGSMLFAGAWSLYSLARAFRFTRTLEIGTFIGKSTISMASGLDDAGAPGEIFTCDMSNAIDLRWSGQTKIHQFPSTSSTGMLAQLEPSFDFAFIDGRLQAEDLQHMERLMAPDGIIALDDFEGVEKGVVNLSRLRSLDRFRGHALVYPPSRELLRRFGLTSFSSTAVLLPASLFVIVPQ